MFLVQIKLIPVALLISLPFFSQECHRHELLLQQAKRIVNQIQKKEEVTKALE